MKDPKINPPSCFVGDNRFDRIPCDPSHPFFDRDPQMAENDDEFPIKWNDLCQPIEHQPK